MHITTILNTQIFIADIAEGFLKDLIDRSLVIVVERRSDGGIKACIVHDLLRDLCVTKAHEENFLQWYAHHMNFVSPLDALFRDSMPRRPLCIHSPNSFRVLDLSSMFIRHFPKEIVQLEDLRFIELRISIGRIPASISNLHYLETLIVESDHETLVVPKSIWKMKNLRHLVLQQEGRDLVDFEDPCFEEAAESYEELLENLETIKSLNPSYKFNDQILERTPNLRKLRFYGKPVLQSSKYLMLPNLGKLNRLQKLNLDNSRKFSLGQWKPCTFSSSFFFPATLKKLTLENTFLEWNEMEKIGMLPNLEVLKLKKYACFGERWETSDGGFQRLKFLELDWLGVKQWNAYSEQFPNLRHLKLKYCLDLEEIPLGLGDIYPLEMLEVRNCFPDVEESAHKIKEDQESKGNDLLKVLISHAEGFL